MSGFPEDTDPRIGDGISWLEIREIRTMGNSAFFNPIVLFCNAVVLKDSVGFSQEVKEMKRASGNAAAFV